uniref:Uncharacterized protein n=1 Tax=Arundo donax TaxID=35708 RepID=A0A0A8ZHM6_ARUDO
MSICNFDCRMMIVFFPFHHEL